MNVARNIKVQDKNIAPQLHISKETILLRALFQKNREYFEAGNTRGVDFRIKQLRKLRDAIKKNEDYIIKALWEDLKKPAYEAYFSEIGILYQEINHAIKNVKKWTKPQKAGAPFFLWPSRNRIVPEPYGMTLIIGPWNYPFHLIIAPLIGAITAGNTAVLKPSELSPRTSKALSDIIGSAFDREYIAVVQGGVEVTRELLNEKFDYIFFTGGTEIGKIIMETAARSLTPVTLELGGKSPVIVDRDASLDIAAKKIVWGKFLNAGQTCLAPDYLLVHQDVKKELMERIRYHIREFYGDHPKESKSYGRIINLKHFQRLSRLLGSGNTVAGGGKDESQLYIEPTVLDGVTPGQPVMQEEIFGPILPVLTFKKLEVALSIIKRMPKPLALYLFSNNKKTRDYIIGNTSSGGVCVNDVILHMGNYNMPFGGVGESGMGSYHGRAGFETFSHLKSVLIKPRLLDIPVRYPPYTGSLNLLRRIFG
jgi:aldehyde dehydrogenase (NAD+)